MPEVDQYRGLGDKLASKVGTKGGAKELINKLAGTSGGQGANEPATMAQLKQAVKLLSDLDQSQEERCDPLKQRLVKYTEATRAWHTDGNKEPLRNLLTKKAARQLLVLVKQAQQLQQEQEQ